MKGKQEDIQSRVMDILNRKNAAVPPTPAINPTLQQAIDSLMKKGPNLLSSLGGADKAGSAAPEPDSNLGGYYANLYGGGGGRVF